MEYLVSIESSDGDDIGLLLRNTFFYLNGLNRQIFKQLTKYFLSFDAISTFMVVLSRLEIMYFLDLK